MGASHHRDVAVVVNIHACCGQLLHLQSAQNRAVGKVIGVRAVCVDPKAAVGIVRFDRHGPGISCVDWTDRERSIQHQVASGMLVRHHRYSKHQHIISRSREGSCSFVMASDVVLFVRCLLLTRRGGSWQICTGTRSQWSRPRRATKSPSNHQRRDQALGHLPFSAFVMRKVKRCYAFIRLR